MNIMIEVPDSTVIITLNALYRAGDDLRLASTCVTDPGDGEKVALEPEQSVKQ